MFLFDRDWVNSPHPFLTLKQTQENLEITRTDLSIPESRTFYLDNFLSVDECRYFIEKSEEIGYHNLEKEFKQSYRNNSRCTVRSDSLAARIWNRVKSSLKKEDVENIRPFGFGNEGIWKPVGLDVV